MKPIQPLLLTLTLALLAAVRAHAATPWPMASGNYFENFNNITNWSVVLTSPTEATRWFIPGASSGVGIPNPTNITIAGNGFQEAATFFSGVQRGTNTANLVLLATGVGDNTNSVAIGPLPRFHRARERPRKKQG